MKHFIYTIAARQRRNQGYANKTVRLYVLKAGQPVLLISREYTFEDDFQAAFNAAEECKALPSKYFAYRTPVGNGRVWHSTTLRQNRVAEFHNLSH